MEDLRYTTFVESLLASLPEIKRKYDAVQEDIDPDVLPYLVVELVLAPLVNDLLASQADADLRRRVFVFLEEMAQTKDIEIVNLLYVGIFEPWSAEPQMFAQAFKYMGTRTKQVASNATHRLGTAFWESAIKSGNRAIPTC